MFDIIVGNICSIGAMVCNSISTTKKDNKDILLIQCISQVFYFAGSFILKGYSACVQNVVGVMRNIFAIKDIKSKILEVFLIVLPVVLGFYFNNRGWVGAIPVLANLEYSLSISLFKNEPVKLKWAFVINMICCVVFNFFLLNFVSVFADAFAAVTTVISIMKTKKSAC